MSDSDQTAELSIIEGPLTDINVIVSVCVSNLSFMVEASTNNTNRFQFKNNKSYLKQQEGQHPLTGQRAPPISGGT